jgi:cholesterol oxidase
MSSGRRFKLGRRSFIRLTATGAAGLYVAGGCTGEPVERVQALVIGSGFGGSIAALRLAEAGVSVTVLERGRRWEISPAHDTFCSMLDPKPDGRAAWMHGRPVIPGVPPDPLRGEYPAPYVGLLQKLAGENIDVVCAAGVGGGSLVYSGIMIQPPRGPFESVFPYEVDYDEMDTIYYPRVREIMRPGSMPDDVYDAPEYASSRAFVRDAELAGMNVERNAIALDWDLVRAELSGEIPAQVIRGEYLYGLNSGAKHSVDRGYLAMAEATGRVEVRPLHQVQAIAEDAEGGYRTTVERIDESGGVLETLTIKSDLLFVAAGSMNTTKLLLRARRDGGLPNLSDRVGEAWGNNGLRIKVRRGVPDVTAMPQGGPACIFVHDHDNPHGPIGMEFGAAPVGLEGFLIHGTQGVPDQLGKLVLNDEDEVEAEWDPSNDVSAEMGANDAMERIVAAAGGEIGSIAGLDESITFHPLGGATMGVVTDTYGRVMGHPGLYVVDSALIPGATPAGNPFWTIAALAERCLETIVAEDLNPPSDP